MHRRAGIGRRCLPALGSTIKLYNSLTVYNAIELRFIYNPRKQKGQQKAVKKSQNIILSM